MSNFKQPFYTDGGLIAESINSFGDKLIDISNAEQATKDRVDISLKEYLSMRDQVRDLTLERDRLRDILESIEAPIDKHIIPGSIKSKREYDPVTIHSKYIVMFEVDERSMR